MNPNLIDDYLKDQAQLTAVEKFSSCKDFRQIPTGQTVYEELIPKSAPGPGQQYAFAVELDRCTGCKACVTACHNENGLEENETWRSVGLIHGGTAAQPVLQHVTTACHHCLDPGCLNGCPVKAYEKDASTGIVKHLEDQCFGCQYCTFTCPYDVPKYIPSKGIVHKCDMCISRLEVGQAPACVRACPSQAILITLVDVEAVRRAPSEYVKIPEAPDSNFTVPTTIYKTSKEFPSEMISTDFYSLKPEHAHWPLVVMLILTQLATGIFLIDGLFKFLIDQKLYHSLQPVLVLIAFLFGQAALMASIFHLGRPLYAFRAFIGLRTSWLSREILLFSLFALFSTLYFLGVWFFPQKVQGTADEVFPLATVLTGLAGVFSSVMVYRKTHRPFWDHSATTAKFFLTVGIMGSATACLMLIFLKMQPLGIFFSFLLMALTAGKLILESMVFTHLKDATMNSLKKTALLLNGPLKEVFLWRFFLGVFGGIVFPFILIKVWSMNWVVAAVSAAVLFSLNLAGELLERYLFFRAVVPLKMPGERLV